MSGSGTAPASNGLGLFTDLYELTMLQAYLEEGMTEPAVFSLFVRKLPEKRNFLLACGIEDTCALIENLRFGPQDLEYLESLGLFRQRCLKYLENFRFSGDVRAVPDGTVCFAEEPLLEVRAPLPEAQILETLVMNQVHLQTLLASKAARVVLAAQGRTVVDFGLRRIHGIDAGLKAARAFHVAGVEATSNVLAGATYGVRVAGTMAHSYVQSHDSELEAFERFAALYPETVLLVDTYDTLEGIRHVIELARRLGEAFRVRAVRLDSGDLGRLAKDARGMLDAAGLGHVRIFASGNLDEYRIAELLADGAPIDAFGVGTHMGVSRDAPSLDIAYKLVEYAGRGRVKLAAGKRVLPGAKQVYREERDGRMVRDTIALAEEVLPGRPLLRTVMRGGRRLALSDTGLAAARERATAQIASLPEELRGIEPPRLPYPVEISPALAAEAECAARAATGARS